MNRNMMALSLVVGLAFACTEPEVHPLGPDSVFEPAGSLSQGVHVLNTQLRGLINPEIEPSPAWGHVQVKLTDNGDGFYSVQWKGKLFNPAGETFSSAVIINGEITPIEILPGPLEGEGPIVIGANLVYTFFRGAAESCDILSFESQAITDEEHMPAEIALAMIINPDQFGVVLGSPLGPRVVGTFGVPDPTEVMGFQSQTVGKKVKCEA